MNLRKIIKEHWAFIAYLVFGGLTTLVNFLIYLPFYEFVGFSAAVSNGIAWFASVIFAFLTNKPFVFGSHDWSMKVVLPEFGKFVGCRFSSGFLETAIIGLTVDYMGWNALLMKLFTSIFVIIINYIGSKLLVFRNNTVKADRDDNLI